MSERVTESNQVPKICSRRWESANLDEGLAEKDDGGREGVCVQGRFRRETAAFTAAKFAAGNRAWPHIPRYRARQLPCENPYSPGVYRTHRITAYEFSKNGPRLVGKERRLCGRMQFAARIDREKFRCPQISRVTATSDAGR